MRLARSLTLVVLTLALSVASAQASIITLNYDFSASGFDPAGPVDPVTGSFSLSYDNATDIPPSSAGLNISITNLIIDAGPAQFSYLSGFSDDRLDIFGGDPGLASTGTDFDLSIQHGVAGFLYSVNGEVFSSEFVTLTPPVPAVPEPASLTLLGLGLAGMGARRWRQRKAS